MIPALQAGFYLLLGRDALGSPANPLFSLTNDNYRFLIPKLHAIAYALQHGEIPFWNPFEGGGGELWAVSSFPALESWLTLLLPPEDVAILVGTFHTFLAMTFFYLFAREERLSAAAATLGAVVWAYSGYHLWYLYDLSLTATTLWIPFLLLIFLKLRRENNPPLWMALGALGLGWMAFNGRPSDMIYNLFVVAGYVWFDLSRDPPHPPWRQPGQLLRWAATLAVPFGLGLGLAMVLLLPVADHLAASSRFAAAGHLAPSIYQGFERAPQLLLADLHRHSLLFIGLVNLPLLVAAHWGDGHLRRVALWLGGFALLCIFPFGLFDALRLLPGHSGANAAYRLLPMLLFAVALLTAVGFHALLSDALPEEKPRQLLWEWPRRFGAPVLLILAGFWVFKPRLLPTVAVTALALAGWGMAWRMWRDKRLGGMFLAFWLALVGGFFLANRGDLSDDRPEERYRNLFDESRHGELIAFLRDRQQERGALRIFSLPGGLPYFTQPVLFGLETLQSYESAPLRRYQLLMDEIAKGAMPKAFLDAAGVDYLIAGAGALPEWVEGEYPVALKTANGRFTVLENPGVAPRAFFAEEVVEIAAEEDQLRWLRKRVNGLERTVLVERTPACLAGGAAPAGGRIERSGRTANTLRLQAWAEGTTLLVVNESWAEGWSARVDGQPVPLERVNLNFRGLCLPPGEHAVEMIYQPPLFPLGLKISLASLAVTLGLLGWGLIRRGRRV
ncbi:MAG: YfhO family protein [Magnetococcales bacterium]|nr:YfhO family protein [Magnetococcales bacterium]